MTSKIWSGRRIKVVEAFFLLAATIGACPVAAVGLDTGQWGSPFQAGRPDLTRDGLNDVPKSRCDHYAYDRCSFDAWVDYDADGKRDHVRMVDNRRVGALVVDFGGPNKRPQLTIASFKGRWSGACYIAPARQDPTAIAFTCPEASAALFKLRDGKPGVRWIGD